MGINKVQYGNTVLIDLTDTTAVASDVAEGKYFYGKDGVRTLGTNSGGGGSVTVTDVANATGTTCVITSGGSPTPPSPETWETIFNGNTYLISDTPYPYWWISSLTDVSIAAGSVWRVSIDGGTEYRLTATNQSEFGNMIGNPLYSSGTDDGSGVPFNFFNAGWGAWSGGADGTIYTAETNHFVKIERLVTA